MTRSASDSYIATLPYLFVAAILPERQYTVRHTNTNRLDTSSPHSAYSPTPLSGPTKMDPDDISPIATSRAWTRGPITSTSQIKWATFPLPQVRSFSILEAEVEPLRM